MKSFCLTLVFISIFSSFSIGQKTSESYIEALGFTLHSISMDDGTKLEYIKSDAKTSQKGLLVYCTGSLPVPLFFSRIAV